MTPCLLELKKIFYDLLVAEPGNATRLVVQGMKLVDELVIEYARKNEVVFESDPPPKIPDPPPPPAYATPTIPFALYCIQMKLRITDAKNLVRDTMIEIALKKAGNKKGAAEMLSMSTVNFNILLKKKGEAAKETDGNS
jgi:hypothetical protein